MNTQAYSRRPNTKQPDVEAEHGRFVWADPVLVLSVLLFIYLRFRVMRDGGAPPTIDAGNWLAFGDSILGNGVRSSTIVYPPVVPLLAKASVSVFGLTDGVSLLGSVSSTAPEVGIYIGLRYLGLGSGSLPPALLVLAASAVGEATAWGGFPQLIGLGLAPIALILFDRFLRTWDGRRALASGLAFMVLLATSHFVGSAVVVAAAVMVVQALARPVGPRPRWPQVVVCSGVLLLPVLWLIPLYLSLLQAVGGFSTEFKFFTQLTWANLFEHIEFLYRDFPWLWRLLLPVTVIAPALFVRNHRTPLWRVTSSFLVAIIATTAVAREARILYLLTPFSALGLALWVVHGPDRFRLWAGNRFDKNWPSRNIAAVTLVALLAIAGVQASTGLAFFGSQRVSYGLLTPELVSGIEAVRESSEPGDVLAVTSLRDAPLGWWVEAIAHRETFYGAPLRWLLFEDEIRRASMANDLFVPLFPTPDRIDKASRAGIDLILVPTRWVFYSEAAIDALAAGRPNSVAYLTNELVVIMP